MSFYGRTITASILLIISASLVCMEARKLNPSSLTFTHGHYSTQGVPRKGKTMMEDVARIDVPFDKNKEQSGLFALFDGHGTHAVSQYAAKHITGILRLTAGNARLRLAQAIQKLDNNMVKLGEASRLHGTCALIALLEENLLTVAHVGDSRAILSRMGQAEELTQDHRPIRPDERERIESIEKRPGECYQVEQGRILGMAVSRALGDFWYKKNKVLINTPELADIALAPGDKFLILATDGIFERDVITCQEAVDIVTISLAENDDPAIAAAKLVIAAQEKGSKDDLSVIIVKFEYAIQTQS